MDSKFKLFSESTLLVICILFFWSTSTFADGFIIIDPLPAVHRSPFPLEVRYHKVNVEINNQTAITNIDQIFYNPSQSRLEGTYMFPVPKNAVIEKFSMYINGRETEAKLLDASKAKKIYENIVVPVSDGTKIFQILANLEKSYNTKGGEVLRSYEKTIVLVTIDEAWKEHLRELDDLRQAVQAAAYEQKDPLLIYKFESYELFKAMIDRINRDVVSSLIKGFIPLRDPDEVQEARAPRRLDLSNLEQTKMEAQSAYDQKGGDGQPDSPSQQQRAVQPVRTGKKIGRNEIVKVRYTDGKLIETKYKKVEQDIQSGRCVLTS